MKALMKENKFLATRFEGSDNCSLRSNLCIGGIPEHIQDRHGTLMVLLQELAPAILKDHLKIEREQRVFSSLLCHLDDPLSHQGADFCKDPLYFQSSKYQVFADVAPTTLAKRRSMKQVQILQHKQIKYHWGLPFSLTLHYNGKQHIC